MNWNRRDAGESRGPLVGSLHRRTRDRARQVRRIGIGIAFWLVLSLEFGCSSGLRWRAEAVGSPCQPPPHVRVDESGRRITLRFQESARLAPPSLNDAAPSVFCVRLRLTVARSHLPVRLTGRVGGRSHFIDGVQIAILTHVDGDESLPITIVNSASPEAVGFDRSRDFAIPIEAQLNDLGPQPWEARPQRMQFPILVTIVAAHPPNPAIHADYGWLVFREIQLTASTRLKGIDLDISQVNGGS
jgi:hypothetical protein